MKVNSVGKYIRKYRKAQGLTQEEFAEKVNLSTNYVSMIERGEKLPSLETFFIIVNALDVSSDMILCEIINRAYNVKSCEISEKLSVLPPEERNKILDILEFHINQSLKSRKQ